MPNMSSVTGIWVKMSITSPRTGMELTNPISTSNTGGNCSAGGPNIRSTTRNHGLRNALCNPTLHDES